MTVCDCTSPNVKKPRQHHLCFFDFLSDFLIDRPITTFVVPVPLTITALSEEQIEFCVQIPMVSKTIVLLHINV